MERKVNYFIIEKKQVIAKNFCLARKGWFILVNNSIDKLTSKEKRKLILIVLGLFLFEIIIGLFFISIIFLYRKADFFFVIASILFPAMVVAVFKASLYYCKDIKAGEVEVYYGLVEEIKNETLKNQPSSYYIMVNGIKHQISRRLFSKIRVDDFVTVRKAPSSHYTVGLVVDHPKH